MSIPVGDFALSPPLLLPVPSGWPGLWRPSPAAVMRGRGA